MKLIKKTVALLLAAVMSLNLLAIPGFAEQRFNYYVTSFQELEDDLAIQYIEDENQFSDLILPDTILAEGYIVSESEESPTIESKKEVQEITFFDVSWELVDTNKQGSGRTRNFIENKYIFAPVITGSCIVAEGVELPKVTAVVKPMINMMALMQPFGVGPFTVPNTASELANHLLSENSDITIVGTPKSTSNLAASSMYDFLNLGTMNVGGKDVEFSLPRGILVTSGSGTPPEKNSPAIYSVTSYGPKDQDVEDLAGVENSQDSFSLQFDFTVPENIPAVKFAFMFGSEEYPDYVDDVVDGAAVIVDGVNYAKFENGTPLKVVTEAALEPNNGLKIEYNGISAPRVINALLDKSRTTHTIKIVIADTSDTIYDSGLFISAMKTSTSEIGGIFESDDASLLSVAGITDNSPGSQSGKEPENAISWNIVVPAGKSSVNAGDIAVAAQATHELYSDSQFTQKLASGESISLIQGDTVPVYIKIRAKNGVTIRYYKVNVTRIGEIDSNDVIVIPYSGKYDGNSHSISVTDTKGGSITYSTSEAGVYTNENPGYRDVGNYTVYYKVDRGENYDILKDSSTVEITKADINSSDVIAAPYSGVYDGKEHSISVADTKGGSITYSTSETGEYTSVNPLYRNVGSYTVYYKVDRGENYDILKSSSTVEITKADINLSDVIVTPYGGTYDGKEHSVSVTDKKGGSITYSTSETGEYTSVNPLYRNVGSYTVYYKVDRGENYNILKGSTTVEITKVDISSSDVIVTPYSGVYDGKEHSISVTDTKGGSITYSTSEAGVYTNEKPGYRDVGSYTVYYKVDRGENYDILKDSSTVEITKADINSSDVIAAPYSGVYDRKEHSISVTDTKGGSITYSTSETGEYTSVNPLYRNVGSYTVYYKVDRGENYDILKGSSKVEITEADINLSDVIATAYSGAYDGNNHSISVTDTRGGSITYSTSETGVYTNENPGYRAVGSYTVYYKVDRGTNYNVLKGLSNVEITKADINSSDVIATPYRGTYDGKEHSISATDTKGGIITYSTSETGVYTNENPGYRDVGSYTVYYKVDRGENYNVLKGSSTVGITKADINSSDVIATAYSGVYDGKEHSISVEDAKGGSITYSTSESEVYTSVKPMYENVGSYTVYYKVDRGTNYNILTDSSIVEITEADMDSSDVTVIPYSGVYDGDNHSISVTDTKGGSITYSIGEAEEYSNEKPEYQDVGSYTIYYKVDRGANYNVLKSSSTVEITKADINSSDVNVTKYSGTYDGNNHSISVTDAKGGSITYSTDESEEHTSKNPEYKNAGSYTVYYKIDRGTNYNILKDSSTVNINLRDVSIKGITVTDKIYDGTADASSHITGAYLDGVLDEDEITLDSSGMTAMFDDGEIGTDKSVTVLGYAIKGLNISQYNLIQPKNITGNILSETSNHVGVLIERVTAREKEYIGGWTNHDVTVIVSGSAPSGVEKYQYTTDGGLIWTDFTDPELLINETTDKSYAFRSISRGGITSDSSNGVEIKVDKIKPVIKDVQGNPTALKNTPQVITFDILEENSGIDLNTLTVSKNGVHIEIKNENGIYSFVAEENGSYEVNVSDYAGNSSDTATVLVNKLDFEKPIISSLTPANKDEEVYTDSLIVTFNEEVMKSASNISGDIIISNSRGQIFDKIDIHNNRVKILGKQLSIYLKRPLEPSTEYYVTIDGGIIYDKAGNSFTGIKDSGTWRFKTNKANITNSIIGIDISVMGEQYSAIVDPNDETIYSAVAKPGINGEIIVKIIPVFLANAELVISSSEEGVSVKGDTVTIYDVNKESANIVLKIKNSDGSFDEKTYTLIIHRGSLETKITKTGINADIDAGNLKGVVDVSSEISNGNNMELELTIVDNEKSLNEAQKLEIANFLNDQEIALYFDVELKLKNFTESYETSISNTQNPVRIKIEIPENMRNGKDYKVIRLHNGVMEILDTVVEGSYLIFETDRFSQYAISYTPVKEKDTKDTNAQGSVLHEHKAYMKGYEDLTYRPENFITRAETATIIARLSTNYDEQKYYINSYNDVDSAAWYANTVGFGTQSKIIKGYEDGSFRPNHSITRAELVSIIARLNNVETEDKSEQHFNDVSGHWAEKYIMALYGLGWIKGYEDGSFRPDASITRAEAVKIINASFGRTPSKEKVDRNISKYKLSFTDVEAGHWAYYEILESAITHIVIDFN